MMNFNLDSQTYGAIRFKSVVPASLAKWIMPGSRPHSAEGAFGTILLQQINTGAAQSVYAACKIREDVPLDFSIAGPVWLTHVALKNETRFDIAGADPVFCLKKLLPFFPFPNTFIQHSNPSKPGLLFRNDHWIDSVIDSCLEQE